MNIDFALPNGNSVKYPTFVAALAKPGDAIIETLTGDKAHAWHMASCIPGEAGELFTPLAKHLAHEEAFDYDNVIEELGDLEFYAQGLRTVLNLDRTMEGATTDLIRERKPYVGIMHSLLELPEVAANVFDATKKWVIYNKPLDRNSIGTALADFTRVIEDIRDYFGITLAEVLSANVTKLGTRYSSLSYSDQQAQVRADKVVH